MLIKLNIYSEFSQMLQYSARCNFVQIPIVKFSAFIVRVILEKKRGLP